MKKLFCIIFPVFLLIVGGAYLIATGSSKQDVMTLEGYKDGYFKPSKEAEEFLKSLEVGKAWNKENYLKELWALTKPYSSEEYQRYSSTGAQDKHYDGLKFSGHNLSLINDNPKVMLCVFHDNFTIVDWMLFSPEGFEFREKGYTPIFFTYIKDMYLRGVKER